MAESKVRRRRRNPKAAYAMEFVAHNVHLAFEVLTPDAERTRLKGRVHDGHKMLAELDLRVAASLFDGDLDPAALLEVLDRLGDTLPRMRALVAEKVARNTAQTARAVPSPLARDYAVSAALRDRERACWARAKPVHDKMLADGATPEDAIAAADQEMLRAIREWDEAHHEEAVAITRWLMEQADAQHEGGA